MKWDRHRLALATILLVALSARVAATLVVEASEPRRARNGDTPTYVAPARALVEDGSYVRRPGSHIAEYYRAPGYPVFLASVYRVFGQSQTAVLLVQALVSTLTIFVVYLIARSLWSPTAGLVGAALVAFEPLQFLSAGTVAAEALDALALAVAVLVGIRLLAARSNQLWWALLLGVTLAVATFIRPSTYYLPLLLAVPLAVGVMRNARDRRRSVAVVAVFLVSYGVCVGSWQLRNASAVGSWRFNPIEARNLYIFRGADVVAQELGISERGARERLLRKLGTPVRYGSQGAYFDEMWSRGFEIFREEPLTMMLQTPKGLASVLFVTGRSGGVYRYFDLQPAPWVLHFTVNAGLVVFYGLTLVGAVAALQRRRDVLANVFALLVPVYVLLVSSGPEAWAGTAGRGLRFRAPIMPLLAVYAAIGIVGIRHYLRERAAVTASTPASRGA